MSISPITASSLYQEHINYFLNAAAADYNSVGSLLARFGVKSTGDKEKDLAKLREIQTKTAVNALQSASEDTETSETQSIQTSHVWYSIMYQLGLNPTGNSQQDFVEIMECLVDKVENSRTASDYTKFMGLIDLVENLFIACGVKISEIGADSVSEFTSMRLLSSYNEALIKKSQNGAQK